MPRHAVSGSILFVAQAKLSIDLYTHTDLLQEPHEARRRDDADLPHEGLRYCQAPLLLAAAFRVSLQKEKAQLF